MAEERQQKINQLQMYEQSMQNILMQKQQFQTQVAEIDSALSELESSEKSYKIIGNIMVLSKKDKVKKDLEDKKTSAELRLKTLEKQENSIKEKSQALQSEVMKGMQKNE